MRSFVYLDEYKMYSLSSQLMEGVTDFVLKESRRSDSDVEEQKGPQDSGKKMAEIIETTSASVEKKFLHDYAYSIFEEKLLESNKVVSLVGTSTFSDLVDDEGKRRLVRIKAKASFLDSKNLLDTLLNLVDMQESISIIATNDRREEILQEMEFLAENSAKKGAFNALKQELEFLSKPQLPRVKAANDRLQYKSISSVVEHGFKGRLDLSMDLADCKVTADLKRSCLKDPEEFLFKTYSRVGSIELVLLAVATQYRTPMEDDDQAIQDDMDSLDDPTLGEVIVQSTRSLHELDRQFTRVRGNQIVVDPIALYLEL